MADWYDDHEDDFAVSMAKRSRMRVYLVAVLIGVSLLGFIAALLQFVPN